MIVAVTGAAGFIGSHLVDRYLREGHGVIGLDDLSTGVLENLASASSNSRFRFVETDVAMSPNAVSEALEGTLERPALILHLASPASPVDYAERPLETMAANSTGTQSCLLAAERFEARLLFASTSESYGDPLQHPQSETYWGNVNPIGPRSCYDESKRFGEALVMSWVRARGADARIIRIFNTYGPRMRLDDGRVVPNFISQAISGRPLTIYGDGSQTRSFCYVDDLVDGIVRAAASERTRGEVVNIGYPREHTMLEFARLVAAAVGVEIVVEGLPLPTDDPVRRRPDISRARDWLGWEPLVDLETGLQRTVQAFKQMTGAR